MSEKTEETSRFAPHFNADGLIPAIAQDAETGDVLMMAWMNEQALTRTLETGEVTYWSRSRQELWCKGASSGNRQFLESMRIDCDQDVLLLAVRQEGPACHTGRRNCFYRQVKRDNSTGGVQLIFTESD